MGCEGVDDLRRNGVHPHVVVYVDCLLVHAFIVLVFL
jgi:hypothetical protein